MKRLFTIAVLSSALAVTAFGEANAKARTLTIYAPALAGAAAVAEGRTLADAACTIYSCPRSFAPGVPLNPEGNLKPGGIP
jgi:hypothetical protein